MNLPDFVYVPVSTELLKALGEWSDLVQVRIVPADDPTLAGGYMMEVRKPESAS